MSPDGRPVPPPFMWACEQCAELLWLFESAYSADKAVPDRDHAARLQDTLSRHVAVDHPSEVPAPHTDGCAHCGHYARQDDPRDVVLWAEHRARGLFLPPVAARLL
ncbi:hypothetical protein [Streptomyces parvulus]|uniref:hypothetical protein n=1 Tax=Streptomyces parvulus TaxID=146923 RepID=UPI0033D4C839